MRSTCSIIVAVQHSEPVTDEELRMALLVMSSVSTVLDMEVKRLMDELGKVWSTSPNKLSSELEVESAERIRKDMVAAQRGDPLVWLGEEIPGNEVYDRFLEWGERLVDKIIEENNKGDEKRARS